MTCAIPLRPLTPADESFTHQVVDTFASVGSSYPSWTEKACAMANPSPVGPGLSFAGKTTSGCNLKRR